MEEEIFQNPYDDEFIPLLLKTPKTLTHRDCSKFFKLVIPHLSNEKLPVDIGQPILMVLSVLIRNEKIRDIFISSGFLYQLPFKNKSYTNEIFMIFNEIVKNSPEAFDDELTNIFASILTRSPQKALSILCSYAQQFNEIDSDNPWPMIDILIQGSKYFVVPELIRNYAATLLFLCTQYADYRRGRVKHCWKIFSSVVSSKTDAGTLETSYNALAVLSEYYKDGEIPLDSIKLHLRIAPEIQDSILALLVTRTAYLEADLNESINASMLSRSRSGIRTSSKLMNSVNQSIFCDHELILTLLEIAQTKAKATLILMKASLDPTVANVILGRGKWLLTPLPIFTDTLRLFLSVFRHEDIRNKVVKFGNFIPFLKLMTNIKNSGVITIICTILRRITISQELLDQMSIEGFIKEFTQVSLQLNDQVSLHAFLLFIDTLAKVGYSEEFIKACEKVSDLTQNDRHLNQIASYVAATLCKYEECAKKMKKLRLDLFFQNNLDDPQIAKGGQKFLRTLDKHELD